MKTKLCLLTAVLFLFAIGCGKKEKPSEKFSGTYKVIDQWSSSKAEIGTGTLNYDLTIVPDGDEGVLLMNVNRTFNGVKAKVTDDAITIPSQPITSGSGTSYMINGYTGKLSENNLTLSFVYSDALYGYSVGEVTCAITGAKPKKEKN